MVTHLYNCPKVLAVSRENQTHLQKLNWDFKSEDTFSHQLNYFQDNSSHPKGEKDKKLGPGNQHKSKHSIKLNFYSLLGGTVYSMNRKLDSGA